MTRRAIGIVAAVVVVLAVGVVAGTRLLGGNGIGQALATPRFVDETSKSGLAHTYDGDASFFVGGGVAVFDCNADRKPDLYVAGGAHRSIVFVNESPVGGPLAFAPIDDPLSSVNGAYPLDIDNDRLTDLAVLRVGGVDLLRGLGDCAFGRANQALGFDAGEGWATAFSAKWEGSNGLPTLAVGRYRTLDASGLPRDTCDDNLFVRPSADGVGYAPAIPLRPGFCTLSMLFSDWDRSGRRDLRVSNDRQYYVDGQEQLWRIAPGEEPRLYTADEGWVSMQIFGMGIASHDLTGDGYPEVYLTSQADNKLQTLATGPGQPRYRDIALKRGVTAAQPFTGGDVLPSTAWHPEFQDVNNDGLVDLFVSKGNVSAMPDYAAKDPSNLFLGQPDGTFREGALEAGIVDFDRGRGAALADFNLDGLLDLVEVNLGAPTRIWRNVGAGDAGKAGPLGNWLGVELRQSGANRDAIGAWIEVRVGETIQRREVTVGGGHIGGQLGPAHFGIGAAGTADVRVTWPDGEAGRWQSVQANRFVELERGKEARTWQP